MTRSKQTYSVAQNMSIPYVPPKYYGPKLTLGMVGRSVFEYLICYYSTLLIFTPIIALHGCGS